MKNADALDLPTLIAAILSTKGGVAKTTDTANLGGYLADQGLKVLMIDADIRQPTL
ncbi:AAA family ATPase, partial [Salmonella enterica subsp. enterica serovar Senftenberg]|nr:AAA family ATPase [Salmonella enterica subsp. enterica serovar Senftenberg]EHW2148916.1 AAA family ATPase [Salmonella enterica subsp. enterica serovar Senftenberg]EHW7592094.1 AAA family ATPase [Salmonella enterica subsp. enterica serovar Senftenberg]HAD8955952.1 ParA family protein [Salmonella enterica]